MRYFEVASSGYIYGVGTGTMGVEITEPDVYGLDQFVE